MATGFFSSKGFDYSDYVFAIHVVWLVVILMMRNCGMMSAFRYDTSQQAEKALAQNGMPLGDAVSSRIG